MGVGVDMSAKWDVSPVKFISVIKQDLAEHKSDLSDEAFQALVTFTPVKTGRLRASWVKGLNTINTYTAPINRQWKKPGDPVLPPPDNRRFHVRTGEKLYISNSVEYAVIRENGSDGGRAAEMVAKMMAYLRSRFSLKG